MRTAKHLGCAGLLAVLMACSGESTVPASEERGTAVTEAVTATRVAGGIRLENGSGTAVAWFARNRGWLAQFALCVDPGPECVRLQAGATITIAESEIAGFDAAMAEAAVNVWRVVADGSGGYKSEDMREIVVPW